MMAVLSGLLGLLGVVILVLTVFSAAPLANLVGLADTSTATVTAKELHVVRLSRGCDFYKFEVEWSDRRGYFTVCNSPRYPATRLEEGDQVEIISVPWTSEVTADGTEGDLFWSVTGAASGIGLTALSVAWVRRYRRLLRGTSVGVGLTGRATKVTRNGLHVLLDTPGLEGRRMVLLPALQRYPVGVGDRVDIWASRRALLGRRPRGPWVVESHRSVFACTHGWLRRRRG